MSMTIEHLQSGRRLPTNMAVGVHINSDTEIEAEKVIDPDEGGEYFVARFKSPGAPMGLTLFMTEEDMLRLWFHFEHARRVDPKTGEVHP